MIPLDQGDPARRRFQDVNCQRSHSRPDLDKMIARLRIKIGDDGAGKVSIEEKILAEHLARTHPDLIKTGAKFGFGHG